MAHFPFGFVFRPAIKLLGLAIPEADLAVDGAGNDAIPAIDSYLLSAGRKLFTLLRRRGLYLIALVERLRIRRLRLEHLDCFCSCLGGNLPTFFVPVGIEMLIEKFALPRSLLER